VNRLRAYRAIEQINQEQLGKLLGISAPMVSAIESGRREPNIDLTVLDYSQDRLTLPDMSEPLHRHRASTKATAKARAQELLRLAGEAFGDLQRQTERAPPLTLERLPPPAVFDDLEDLSREVRLLLQHEEHGPIRNLTAAVERAGVCLVPIAGLDGIDGLSSWVGAVPVIGISPAIPGDRFRFTLAHELAHLLVHKRRSENSEHEANRFAGALLFPRDDFIEAMPQRPQLRDFVGLKSSWGVAASALVYRAHELDVIDDKRYRALQIQMSKWRKSEPANFSPVYGQLLPRLIEVNGGSDTVGKNLGLNRRHLTETIRWQHLRVA